MKAKLVNCTVSIETKKSIFDGNFPSKKSQAICMNGLDSVMRCKVEIRQEDSLDSDIIL